MENSQHERFQQLVKIQGGLYKTQALTLSLSDDEYKELTDLIQDEYYFNLYHLEIIKSFKERMNIKTREIYTEIEKSQITLPSSEELEIRPAVNFEDGGDYFGQWRKGEDIREGTGIYIYKSGQVYQGTWKDNLKSGQGLAIDKGGLFYYQGEHLYGESYGQGTYISKTGYEYTGQWKYGKANGFGVEKFPSGNRYEGNFVDDKRDGQGAFYYSWGNIYKGEFKNNKFEGYGHLIEPDGSQYFGNFDIEKTGIGSLVLLDGRMFTGEWRNGSKLKGIFTDTKGKEHVITDSLQGRLALSKLMS